MRTGYPGMGDRMRSAALLVVDEVFQKKQDGAIKVMLKP
jgi:hypothetical protein